MLRKLVHTFVEAAVHPLDTNLPSKKEIIPFEWIASSTPCFSIAASNIKILNHPEQFYNFLLQCCQQAKYRVTLASLYLGVGNLEEKLIHALANNQSFKEKKLIINILLDYTRGSRSHINSRTMLLPLLQTNEDICQVSLYHTPVLRGWFKKYIPSPFNELLGLQHMKVYVFDDVLIISGANLSNDYFTNRQDRYFVIKDERLSSFYCGLVHQVQKFSLKMDKNNNLSLHQGWKILPYIGNKNQYINEAKSLIMDYLHETQKTNPPHPGSDTWVYPLIQMGQLQIEHDTLITKEILAQASDSSKLKFATGYFNLTDQYSQTLIELTKSQCDILMAHPKTNGFLGAKGSAGNIPYAYSLLSYKFRKKVSNRGQDYRIKLFEYLRDDWTYHAKGIWYYPPHSNYPNLTLVGSPNFGERSAKRDLETQIAIVTENEQLKKDLHNECSLLYKSSIPADTDRPVPKWLHLFILVFRNFF